MIFCSLVRRGGRVHHLENALREGAATRARTGCLSVPPGKAPSVHRGTNDSPTHSGPVAADYGSAGATAAGSGQGDRRRTCGAACRELSQMRTMGQRNTLALKNDRAASGRRGSRPGRASHADASVDAAKRAHPAGAAPTWAAAQAPLQIAGRARAAQRHPTPPRPAVSGRRRCSTGSASRSPAFTGRTASPRLSHFSTATSRGRCVLAGVIRPGLRLAWVRRRSAEGPRHKTPRSRTWQRSPSASR